MKKTKRLNELIPIQKDLNGLQEKPKKHSETDIAIVNKYGDARKFAETFNPDLQKVCADNLERSFTGNAPTINTLRSAYSERQVRVWILAQLENLNQYAGVNNKMEPNQMVMCADVIIRQYGYFKATELLLFFFLFKSGKYGQLYGSVDPMRVTTALAEFNSYRKEKIFMIQKEQERQERDKNINEYLEKKRSKININRL